MCLTKFLSRIILLGVLVSLSHQGLAEESDEMTDTAKVGQKIVAKFHPLVQLPFLYNYNQNRAANQGYKQSEFEFNPIIPVFKDESTGFIVRPMLTDYLNVQNQKTANQVSPVQLASYLTHKTGDFSYGAGPFIQIPTANTASGSQQAGLGLSYGGYYEPNHWVVGVLAYNAWGVGNNRSAGTANVYSYDSVISYTTDNAWTVNLQSWVNGNPTNGSSYNTNQVLLSAGKTIKVSKAHIFWQIGPSYMVTKTPVSPQGWGGFFSFTVAFSERQN